MSLDNALASPHSPFSPPPLTISGDRQYWGDLHGSGLSLAIANSGAQAKGSSLVIASNMSEAEKLYGEIKTFLADTSNPPEVILFADWETLPYDIFSPHQDIVSERMHCLYQLANNNRCLVVVSAKTLAQRLVPQSYLLTKSLVLKNNDTLDREQFRDRLIYAGYNCVDTVYQHGEFAVRGSLIDIYPMGSRAAYRIELFDDSVDSLREFDPESQRTIVKVDKIELLPAKECPLDRESIARFKERWHSTFDHDPKQSALYVDICDGIPSPGIEYYLPLFFSSTSCLLDYLPKESPIYIQEGFNKSYEEFWLDVQNRYESRCVDPERPILKPDDCFFPINQTNAYLKEFPRVILSQAKVDTHAGRYNFDLSPPPLVNIDNRATNPLHLLEKLLYETDKRVLFCAESSGRRESLKSLLQKIDIHPEDTPSIHSFLKQNVSIGITVANLDQGISCNLTPTLLIAESQIFGNQVRQARRRKKSTDPEEGLIKNLTELKIGAAVVHIDHGVGRYQGLETIEHDGQASEFLYLEYANQAKLFVPVTNLHLISRYSGGGDDTAPLHKLGNDTWGKAKRKAAEKVRDVAAELLEVYAKRKAKQGFSHELPKLDYELFCSGFPFEETPDQEAAINAVKDDMLSSQPMDRLVCGDVGFGKTEVAMRAAFIALQNNKQVVVLVPTTLLAQQHYENFVDRFADWPANIEVISRFKTGKETSDIQKKIESGQVDIVIGTHKLIQGDTKFNNLGLMIIDEEHRFGVRQKEALKALRADIDMLNMTATPIPRTLNMSMSGIRDLSIIATPPAKRLSVKTFVRQSDEATIKEAILREIMRGGQVFYLHNEVQTIEKVARDIETLIPEAKVNIGHGQMRERELESVMSDFYHKRFNILVCTTIIETGIDVPSANTIIIDRADKFGLAQLHQLRGRVGRSHHQAYAYLLTPHKKAMTSDAVKRLEAISEAQDLGAGFMLASHDMEIRGAGELLGEDQSGQMQTIGFSLYMEMLDRAVKSMQSGKTVDLDSNNLFNIDINLRIPALIPDDYLPDVSERLTLYKRVSSAKNTADLNELQVEMIDRFGLLPDTVKNLFNQTELKFEAERLGIEKIEAGKTSGKIVFSKETKVDPFTIVKLVQKQPQNYRLEGATGLKFIFEMNDTVTKFNTVNAVIQQLSKAN